MMRNNLFKISLVGTAMLALSQVSQIAATPGVGTLGNGLDDCFSYTRLQDFTEALDLGGIYPDDVDPYPFDVSGTVDYENYETVSCSFVGECPDGVVRNTCSWQRYLATFCLGGNNPAILSALLSGLAVINPFLFYIASPTSPYANAAVQQIISQGFTYQATFTNSLPNHCYFVDHNAPVGSASDFNAYILAGVFNPNILLNDIYLAGALGSEADIDYVNFLADDQQDIDNQLCDHTWAKPSFIPKSLAHLELIGLTSSGGLSLNPATLYSNNWVLDLDEYPLLRLPTPNSIVGIALNGVFFFSGSSHYGYDAFFPKAYGTRNTPQKIDVDVCLGTADNYNTYRYHMFSPCIYDISLRSTAQDCASDATCSKDVRNHSLSYIPDQLKSQDPVGIAKDGRIIYGPYRNDGELWQPCDVDICNGVKFSRLNYGYVSTMFHPYIVGCWGPGNRPVKKTQSCSTNGRYCAGAATTVPTILATIVAVTAAFFY